MSSIPPFIATSRNYLLAGETRLSQPAVSLESWGHAGLLTAFCALLALSGLFGGA